MELKQKGSEVAFGSFRQAMMCISWTTDDNFDLVAVYETKEGETGFVYWDEPGDLYHFPFIVLEQEAYVVDCSGDNEQCMRLTRLDPMKYVWILCLDYSRLQDGKSAYFEESGLNLKILIDSDKRYHVNLDTNNKGNVVLIATIDNTSFLETKLLNSSKVGTLKGLKELQQLLDIIHG